MEKGKTNTNTTGAPTQIRKYVFLEKFERTKTAIKEQFKTVDKKIFEVGQEAKANTSWTGSNKLNIDANSKRINELNKKIKVNRIVITGSFLLALTGLILVIKMILSNL